MKTVFLSGSRTISRLNNAIRNRMDNIVSRGLTVIVGDANGADKAMQAFLANKKYPNVVVFHSGGICRNNIGAWASKTVPVAAKLKGRAFYTAKDKAMAAKADVGLVLWDGKSKGSLNNVFELINNGKKAVVYISPKNEFIDIKNPADAHTLLQLHDARGSDKF